MMVLHETLFPKIKAVPLFANVERIFQRTTDFIRGNVLVSTASVGAGITGLVAAAAIVKAVRKRKKRKAGVKRAARRRGKKTKAQIKRTRLRNLAKARRARRTGKRKIIRGQGLGRGEIKHSGKGTKGTKVVAFTTKGGIKVRFKVKGTSKRRRGFRR